MNCLTNHFYISRILLLISYIYILVQQRRKKDEIFLKEEAFKKAGYRRVKTSFCNVSKPNLETMKT